MNNINALIPRPREALQIYEPRPRVTYSIEATARITDLPRHTILVYYKRGLVSPMAGPEQCGFCFNDKAIRTLRRIEELRRIDGVSLRGIKRILDLTDEVERLQGELRSLRENPSPMRINETERTYEYYE
jgi:MerR family transcriptional regulator/heat shock protein HspR